MTVTQADRAALEAHRLAVGGLLEAENVVLTVQAQGPAHPLYHRFLWDNEAAGHQFRIQQARELIGAFYDNIRTVSRREVEVPAYVHDVTERHGGYISRDAVAADPVKSREVLAYTLVVARGHVARGEALAAAFGLNVRLSRVARMLDTIIAELKPGEAVIAGEEAQSSSGVEAR